METNLLRNCNTNTRQTRRANAACHSFSGADGTRRNPHPRRRLPSPAREAQNFFAGTHAGGPDIAPTANTATKRSAVIHLAARMHREDQTSAPPGVPFPRGKLRRPGTHIPLARKLEKNRPRFRATSCSQLREGCRERQEVGPPPRSVARDSTFRRSLGDAAHIQAARNSVSRAAARFESKVIPPPPIRPACAQPSQSPHAAAQTAPAPPGRKRRRSSGRWVT